VPNTVNVAINEADEHRWSVVVTVAGDRPRVVSYPSMSRVEADGLAESITRYVQDGYLIDLLLPEDALDKALRESPTFRDARRSFQQALGVIPDRSTLLAVEESANALAARAAEVGYHLGAAATLQARGDRRC